MKRTCIQFLLLLCAMAATGFAHARPGDSRDLGERDWSAVSSMAAADGRIYIGSAVALWESDRAGKARALKGPAGWGRTTRLASLDGKVYAINEEKLYEVDPKGGIRHLGDDWPGVRGMAGLDGKLYIVSGEELYAVEKNGQFRKLGEGWYNVKGMAAVEGKLYIVSRDRVHEVDLATGQGRAFGDAFENPHAMAAADGRLFVFAFERNNSGRGSINEPAVFAFAPGGAREKLQPPKGWEQGTGTSAMAADGANLYLSMPSMSRSRFFSLSFR